MSLTKTRQCQSDAGSSIKYDKNQSVDHRQFNIVSPQFKANPFPLVASLRASQPVFRTVLSDKTPVWLLTRYEDVATLLKDERFVRTNVK
jgi:cytochrome P450